MRPTLPTPRAPFVQLCCLLPAVTAAAAAAPPPPPGPVGVIAVRAVVEPRLDGRLDEPAWREATPLTAFTQREPDEGAPASDSTAVRVLYTDKALWIGVRCAQPAAVPLAAKGLKRDFDWEADDNVQILLDTLDDDRTGTLFITNPNGARADVQIGAEEQDFNVDWNGVWDVRVARDDGGWTAEFMIPFSTVRFRAGEFQTWGLNVERSVRARRETVSWRGWSRDHVISHVDQAGRLEGIRGIRRSGEIEVLPYIRGGVDDAPGADARRNGAVGVDVNLNVTSGLKLNLTANTDFAEAEVDQSRINLTRFPIFFPEKRAFFLEGADRFAFTLDWPVQIFYSRRIGLDPRTGVTIGSGEKVPVLGGARLYGTAGRWDLGLLSLWTDAHGELPVTNWSVARVRRDIGRQSSIGLIGAARAAAGSSNLAGGVDAVYATSAFAGRHNFELAGALAASDVSGRTERRNLSWRVTADYPNDAVDLFLGAAGVQRGFQADTGWDARNGNYRVYSGALWLQPRPHWPGVRQLRFKPFGCGWFVTDDTGRRESVDMSTIPLGVLFTSGDYLWTRLRRESDRVDDPFLIGNHLPVAAGEYWWNSATIAFESYGGRRWSVSEQFDSGDYYAGTRRSLTTDGRYSVNRHLSVSGEYAWNRLAMAGAQLVTHEVGARIEYAFSPDLHLSLFTQFNNGDRELFTNLRLAWIPRIGSDVYFVFNQGYDTTDSRWASTGSAALAKVVWRFVI
ncbi:MAG: carbohydrate binding family 9 domain-containing protein [Candidatus Krumholzibacteriia bacterium]